MEVSDVGKSAPKAPDPTATAAAQGAANVDTARVQARLNRGDTNTPYGSVTQRDMGQEWLDGEVAKFRQRYDQGLDRDQPYTAGGAFDEAGLRSGLNTANPYRDMWTTNVNLSPEQQTLYNQGVQLDTQTGQLALDMLPSARTALEQPFAVDDPDARNRATAGIMSRLEPQFQRDREGLESRLTAQGFRPGSEAYTRAADELNRSMTDTRLQADALGSQESRAAAAFQNAIRGQRINELGMIFGLGPGMQQPQQAQMAQVGVNAPDVQSAIYNNYQTRAQGANAGNSALAQLLGSAVGFGIGKWG